MSKSNFSNPTNTFVIRIWKEWSIEESVWRGSIEHLESKKQAGFKDFNKMLAFLRSTCNFLDLEDQQEKEED